MRIDSVPLLVRVAGQRVVCVGAGPVAAGKVRGVIDAGAQVVVIAPDAGYAVRDAAEAGRLEWRQRVYRSSDVADAVLVIAATSDTSVNARVASDAARMATLCVRVDRPADGEPSGTAAFLATLRHGPLLLAVSTHGAAPALSRRIRRELAERYGSEYGALAEVLGELRDDPRIRRALSDLSSAERRARWRSVLDTDILNLVSKGRLSTAKEVAAACLCSSSD